MTKRKRDDHWGWLLAALVLVVPALLIRAWVISVMWIWFVVPLGAPPVGYAHALGIGALAAFLSAPIAKKEDRSFSDLFWEQLGRHTLGPLLVVGAAWIIWSLM